MNRYPIVIFSVLFVLGLTVLNADPSRYEFKVASTEFAVFYLDKSAEPLVKEWAQKHRPKLYKIAFVEKAAADKSKEGFGALVALGSTIGARADLFLDYYLNDQAKNGWEPFQIADKTILLRRERKEG